MLRNALSLCLFVLVWMLAGCGTNPVGLPATAPRENRPPVIYATALVQTDSGFLRLNARVLDADLDAVEVDYVQILGPATIQRARQATRGVLEAILEPTDVGLHTFVVFATDGRVERSAELSIFLTREEQVLATTDLPSRLPPTGVYNIRLTGQVIADEGQSAFALDGTLEIATVRFREPTRDPVSVILGTRNASTGTLAPPGRLTLVSRNELTDLLAATYLGNELILAGEISSLPTSEPELFLSPGEFKTAEADVGSLDVAAALVRIRFSGDRVSGEIFLSSRPTEIDLLPQFAEYAGQFTGNRAGGR